MTIIEIAQLIELLKSNGVTRFKSDDIEFRFRENEKIESPKHKISLPRKKRAKEEPETIQNIPNQAIPAVSEDIPHYANEVLGMLRMSDEELVDRLFPDQNKGDVIAN
jgi:hypothetical protein